MALKALKVVLNETTDRTMVYEAGLKAPSRRLQECVKVIHAQASVSVSYDIQSGLLRIPVFSMTTYAARKDLLISGSGANGAYHECTAMIEDPYSTGPKGCLSMSGKSSFDYT